jgi:hypothetical protein
MNEQKKEDLWNQRSWIPWLAIMVVSAAAHLWCVRSQFFLDDLWQIRDSGTFHGDGHTEAITLRWFYLMLQAQVSVFGMSAPAIHAFNWLLHTGVAVMLWKVAGRLLPGRSGTALWCGLLFAVHPLGSEIPNYARCQDIAWVTLFSLVAAHQMIVFLQRKKWWHLALCGLFVMGATFSKGPGMLHALMMVGTVTMCLGLPMLWKNGKNKVAWLLGAAAVLVACAWTIRSHLGWDAASARWSDPRMIGHAFTLSRVFWRFCGLAFWPNKLCADHHIEETLVHDGFWNVKDTESWWAMAGMAGVMAMGVALMFWSRSRIVGLSLFLFVGAIVMRLAFFVPEYMPEYRIYPGLPWFCLAVGLMSAACWRWMSPQTGQIPVIILINLLAVLSAKRSAQWHDLNTLMSDVLQQYPANARAIWVMQRNDIEAGRWQAVIDRHTKDLPLVTQRFHAKNKTLQPLRELPTGHHALAEVGCTGLFARAVAELHGGENGMKVIDGLEIYMRGIGLDPQAHLEHWLHFKRAKAWMLHKQGRDQEAYDLLHDIALADSRLLLKEIEQKLGMRPQPAGP